MSKKLIITEKPSVARDFARVLNVNGRQNGYIENNEYVISWCVGHLVGMVYPEEYDIKFKKWRLEDLPFLPREYKYGVLPQTREQYEIVHGLLQREDIDVCYWAGDAGKEGQVIEENIRNYGGVRPGMKELRVWIDSQTDEELLRGIREARPMEDYASLGLSGIMRTIEDYAMGINFSRVMSIRYGNLLNKAANTNSYQAIAVGRVMTCVLGMVVIREREIRAFTETPFYRIIGSFTDFALKGEWKAVEGSKYFESPLLYKENGFKREEDARTLISLLSGKDAEVLDVEKSIEKKKAPLLFNLAELQAECGKRFKLSPDETLNVAQTLYERKLTTYPRTDARVLTEAVAKEIDKNLHKLKAYEPTRAYVDRILEEESYKGIIKSKYVDDSKVTDHYAIIPTGQLTELSTLNERERQVYDLIVRRFLSIFYKAAEYQLVKLRVMVDGESFFSNAKVLKDPGYLEISGKAKDKDDKDDEEVSEDDREAVLKAAESLKKGDIIPVNGYDLKEGKTSPPKRYTSPSMILAMENAGNLIEDEELRAQIKGSGIGTSATRAGIIKKLVDIGYLNENKKTLILTPEVFGEMVYEVVDGTVPQLLNPKMSASWEKGLDGITNKTVEFYDYREKLEEFIRRETLSMMEGDLAGILKNKLVEIGGETAVSAVPKSPIGAKCPACGGEMTTTPFGYGCENYKKEGDGCNFAIGQIAGRSLSLDEVKTLLNDGKTGLLKDFKSKEGKKFDAVLKLDKDDESGFPKIVFDFDDKEAYNIEDFNCPVCNSPMKKTAFGFGCSAYDAENHDSCKFSIGTICGKTLSLDQAKKLIKEGRTETIRGFKSKNGKRFDACLKFSFDEKNVPTISFDFDNVEKKVLKDVSCPKCGKDINVTSFGFGCSGYQKDSEDSCNFLVGKIAGRKIKESELKALLKDGKTDLLSGFKSKAGKSFDAVLVLEDGEIRFNFPDAVAPVESNINCPVCNYKLIRTKYNYECACGFKISHIVAKLDLSEEVIAELLAKGSTSEKLIGFTSKSGSSFEAYLKYNSESGISFDFERGKTEAGKEVSKEDK